MPPESYPYDYDWNRHYAEKARREAEAQKALEAQRQRELEARLQAQKQARAMILNQAFVSPPQAKTYPPKKCLKA